MKKLLSVIAAGILVICGSLSAAHARVNTDIGIYFPMGGGRRHVEGRDNCYAALTYGRVVEELFVAEKAGRLLMKLKVTNEGDAPYTVEHRSGQVYDFVLLDEDGKELYRFSDGMAYTQAVTSSSIEPHKSETYKAEIDSKVYKKIKTDAVICMAFIVDTPFALSTSVPDAHDESDGGTAIGGAIRIGNSNGYPWWW